MGRGNHWLTTEIKTLRDAYQSDENISPWDIAALLPRHSRSSIDAMVVKLNLRRANGAGRYRRGWAAVESLLRQRPMTRDEMGAELGKTGANIAEILRGMKGHWHTHSWRETSSPCCKVPVVSLGAGKDAPYPKVQKKRSQSSIVRKFDLPEISESPKCVLGAGNPFATAAGLISAPQAAGGRVYIHLHDEELEAA